MEIIISTGLTTQHGTLIGSMIFGFGEEYVLNKFVRWAEILANEDVNIIGQSHIGQRGIVL